jgi:hypothetical protein
MRSKMGRNYNGGMRIGLRRFLASIVWGAQFIWTTGQYGWLLRHIDPAKGYPDAYYKMLSSRLSDALDGCEQACGRYPAQFLSGFQLT